MQDIENDMDDLFRRAVDNYTLEPGVSNWDTIVSQLSDDETITVTENNRKNNVGINVILSLILLFIPISTAMYSYYYSGIAATKSEEGTKALSYKPARADRCNTIAAIQKNAVKIQRISIEKANA